MLAVIQQPYFLPWLGYLAKAKAADVFVLLDDAPFRRNHLHRTRTLSAQGEPLWLSVPVGAHQGHALDQIHLPAVRTYIDALLKSLQLSYGRGGHFRAEFPFITDVLAPIMQSVSVSNLSQQNILLLQASCEYLDIACDFVCASTIATPAERTARTVALLANVAAEGLVLGDGASSTVHDLGTIRRTAELFMLPYSSNHPQYRQSLDRGVCRPPRNSYCQERPVRGEGQAPGVPIRPVAARPPRAPGSGSADEGRAASPGDVRVSGRLHGSAHAQGASDPE